MKRNRTPLRRPYPGRVRRLDYRSSGYFERTPDSKVDLTVPRWVLPVGLGVMAVLFVVWFFTKAPWLKVKNIRIEGEATQETRAEIEKLRGQNILWLSVTRPEEAITQQQPSIKEIQILRGIPDTLRVKLIERQPAVIWQVDDRWYTLDPSGFAFREQRIERRPDGSLNYPGTDLPVVVDTKQLPVKIGQTVVRSEFVSFLQELRHRFPSEFNLQMVRGEVGETSFNVTAVTDAGWNVLFDTTRKLDPQLRTLKRVLESKRPEVKQYVDVRVRGWVYYK